MLFFLKTVLDLDFAALAILSGQIADAIATPVIGVLSDRTESKIGKRTPWYIFGYVLVTLTFLPIFHRYTLVQIWPSLDEE